MNLPQKRRRRFSLYTDVVYVFFLDNRRVRESEPARSNERARVQSTRAQLFEGRLALNLGLNLTWVSLSCVQKHFLG